MTVEQRLFAVLGRKPTPVETIQAVDEGIRAMVERPWSEEDLWRSVRGQERREVGG